MRIAIPPSSHRGLTREIRPPRESIMGLSMWAFGVLRFRNVAVVDVMHHHDGHARPLMMNIAI